MNQEMPETFTFADRTGHEIEDNLDDIQDDVDDDSYAPGDDPDSDSDDEPNETDESENEADEDDDGNEFGSNPVRDPIDNGHQLNDDTTSNEDDDDDDDDYTSDDEIEDDGGSVDDSLNQLELEDEGIGTEINPDGGNNHILDPHPNVNPATCTSEDEGVSANAGVNTDVDGESERA